MSVGWRVFLVVGVVSTCGCRVEATADVVELYLLPHTHADVGWLQTVDSLSRVNVSRILNGVVGNLMNDTAKRRRFVWDEMAFLQLWWDKQATDLQKRQFTQLVAEKRIEFTDNGWSQHDMGCTTLDSMISNWVEGHQWLLEKFGENAQPKIGWSLDPFGLSGSQAVFQSLMGMEAWFFTRVGNDVVADMKGNRSVEFIWRASSSLPAADTEIFAHVFESYYCMPLPTYAFEWGPDKGAKVPDSKNIIELSQGLANLTIQRAKWFRTPNVLIPWGCDYTFQNAELMYRSTDWIIDTINDNPQWGVHAQYTTPSEYLAAVKTSAASAGIQFPVKTAGTNFFPYNGWSGYFTSRPSLKGNSQAAVSRLLAAETLFALHADTVPNSTALWGDLEISRRNNGIVQHHDAITGTGCSNGEGCSGSTQDTGPHNVIADYQRMLAESSMKSDEVIGSVLSSISGEGLTPNGEPALSADPSVLGNILMGGGDGGDEAVLIVWNPLGSIRTEAVNIPVPICAVRVFDADSGNEIVAQVTAQIGISTGMAPFYDFELQFEAMDIPALGFRRFRLSPKSDVDCHGGNLMENGLTTIARHTIPGSNVEQSHREDVIAEATRRQGNCGDLDRWNRILREVEEMTKPKPKNPCQEATLRNAFFTVYVDPCHGVAAIYDIVAGKNYSLTHDLMLWPSSKNDAYGANISTSTVEKALLNRTLSSTVAIGPVLQEVWLQITPEHKTRIRLWNSQDVDVGGRIEFGHRIGVLEPFTEVSSRFTLKTSGNWTLFSEDNGYEKIAHQPPARGFDPYSVPSLMYPSQMSVFAEDGTTQLSLALDRSHAVGSLASGAIEIMQHRRGGPYLGSGETVVLDDVDRIFTETWLSIGDREKSNRMRIAMRQRLNHPLVLVAGLYNETVSPEASANSPQALPEQIHLQSIRASDPKSQTLLVRFQHLYASGEDSALSSPTAVDVQSFLTSVGIQQPTCTEMTLDGMRSAKSTCQRTRYPAEIPDSSVSSHCGEDEADIKSVSVKPFELRTFRVTRN